MRLTLRQMQYVDEVARSGSVQGASKKLGISQSSILAAISAAEDLAGARMFDRRPAKGVVATPVGNQFLSSVRMMLEAEGEFVRSVSGVATKPPQTITIGCFDPFSAIFMTDLLKRYVDKAGPSEIILMEGDLPQLRSWLADNLVDFAVTFDYGRAPGRSITPLCTVKAHAILPINDPLARKKRVSINEVLERPFVLLNLPESVLYFTALFNLYKAKPKIALRTRSYEALCRAVGAGFGVAIGNMRPIGGSHAAEHLLMRRPFSEDIAGGALVVADSYGASKPWFLRLFIEVAEAFFREAGLKHFVYPVG
ncbi:transcriptional regulator, LysR family [Bradyrhizobium brasilense]|uniref:Transcriptional regulator, LysR family n=1 Tax=Bradyrhizobium brasilense TaxID=1419277 RepID=A0A1G7Q779_9BRAD|nr:LysR family transcriptional regulator [Bradyrhizobium brasilense]SDF94376.1 transcriptional regulator, LysR family [Bradyrhizobium brasilense]